MTMYLVAVLAAAEPSLGNAPSPQPSALPEIAHVRSSAACQALNELVLPVALVVQKNDGDFVNARKQVVRFAGGSVGEAAPNISNDPVAARDLDEEGNDASTYTPNRTIAASNIDRVTGEILTNLAAADRVMNDSWKKHPKSSDPAYDAVRQRVQNIIDLQRVYAFRLGDIAGSYFSNAGNTTFLIDHEVASFQDTLQNTMRQQIVDSVGSEDPLSVDPAHLPNGDVSDVKNGSAVDVADALRVQKLALSIESMRLGRACDGLAPVPATTP